MAITIDINTHRALRNDIEQAIREGEYNSSGVRFECPIFSCEKTQDGLWLIEGWVNTRRVSGYFKHLTKTFFPMNGVSSFAGQRIPLTEYDVLYAGQIIDGYLNGKNK